MKLDLPDDLLDLAGILHGSRAFIGPEHVVLDLTNRCELNCLGCWTYSPLLRGLEPPGLWKHTQLRSAMVETLIDDLADLGTKRIRFTGGGEPFLHHNALAFARRIKERGMTLAVTTSFTPVTVPMIDTMIDLGLDTLSVSLWAGTAETFSRTHPNRTERTFERVTENLRHLLANRRNGKPELILLDVVCSTNFHEVRGMLEYALELGADGVYYTLVDAIRGRTDGLLLNAEQRNLVLAEAPGILARVEEVQATGKPFLLDNFDGFLTRLRSPGADLGVYDKQELEHLPCTVGWHFCRILADGRVAPCCRGAEHPLGDLKEQRFKDIWHSPTYDDFRRKARDLPKTDPYFHRLGCYIMCDNLMHIRNLERKLAELPGEVRAELQRTVEGLS
ncbi:MAG: hypothetical protein A2284_11005 [Deltaproteobacteria bacterium RIFOXYA12_FULL_61_11]|nr:MAG: hypothetical protein A2284_11005 [Deltaproteobacteria bacterium RIFOXYA12_FULL_61_11]